MSSATQSGRKREVEEIVMYERAAEVGRLIQGELKEPMQWISFDEYLAKSRKELIGRKNHIRTYLRSQIQRLCRSNFENVTPKNLARLYEPLYVRGSIWRLPFSDFIEQLGMPKEDVLRGAPLHSTISLSYLWGLQTEYPEMHLVRDIALSFNAVLTALTALKEFEKLSLAEAKAKQLEIARIQAEGAFNRRMCVLSCFNLVEAYINGLAWEYVQTQDTSEFSSKKRNILTEEERPVNILDKLVKIPRIIAEQEEGPLHETREPLKSFIETVKPYRDSIVHASPFSASERFGGYDKLSKIYVLHIQTLRKAVDTTFEVISIIHQFIGGRNKLPDWVYSRNEDGTFEIMLG